MADSDDDVGDVGERSGNTSGSGSGSDRVSCSARAKSRDSGVLVIENKKSGSKYALGDLLGKGGMGKVYACFETTTGKEVAVKIISKSKLDAKKHQSILKEVKMHRLLQMEPHCGIVRLDAVFEDIRNIYMTMEVCQGSLRDLVLAKKKLSETEARGYMVQILEAVAYIHACGVVHRDLKVGNVLFDTEGCIKVCDFGFATEVPAGNGYLHDVCGTPNYIAPEILDCYCKYRYEVDVWSLGVLMSCMLVGTPPFHDVALKKIYKNIVKLRYTHPFADQKDISEAAKAFIASALQLDPAKRPSVKEMQEHVFFIKGE